MTPLSATNMILTDSPPPGKPKLLDRVRWHLRLKHYSIRTEESYVDWIRRFILFHGKRHPEEMGEAEIAEFLSHLANVRQVSASTQNQAFSALLFLYQQILERKLESITRSPLTGWRWVLGHLDAAASIVLTGTLLLVRHPSGDAVLLTAQASADGLTLPAQASAFTGSFNERGSKRCAQANER